MTAPRTPLVDLGRVADAVSRALEPSGESLVDWIARTARAVFGAAACSIALLTDDGTELVFTTVTGGDPATVSGLRIPAHHGISGWVATTGQPLAVSDVHNDPRFASDVAENTGYMPSAILACPVSTDQHMLGVIEILDRDTTRSGSDADIELLSLFAHQAALAIDASERSRRLGAVLVRAYAEASDGDLATALEQVAQGAGVDDELPEVAAAFARLAQASPAEWRLAVDVLESVARYAARTRG